jgi:ABC-type glycerol-3-phosphate transport system substrate-binding protein
MSQSIGNWPRSILLLSVILAGCPQPSAAPSGGNSATNTQPLRLLVVDDEALGQAIGREWQASTEETVEVKNIATSELAAASRLPGDVIVFPTGLVGQLIDREMIEALDDEPLGKSEFDRRDIFDQIRLREMTWGNRTVATPLGSPQLLLCYRPDVFDKLGLQPPRDWAQYQQLLPALSDRAALADLAPPVDQPWRATTEPLADGWAGQLLLCRAAPYAAHRDQISLLFDIDSCEPLIDRPPYTRALKELAAAAEAGGFGATRLSPPECLDELLAGHSAMALGWPAPRQAASKAKATADVRFALIPGATLSYNFATKRWENSEAIEPTHVPTLALAGRMAAVSKNATSRKRSESFVLWLAGKQTSTQIGPRSGWATLFRTSQIADAQRWTGGLNAAQSKQYADTLATALALPQVSPGLRLPGRIDYLAALDQAVQRAAAGESTPVELLAETKQKWSDITAVIGVEKQKLANLRCLGQSDLP